VRLEAEVLAKERQDVVLKAIGEVGFDVSEQDAAKFGQVRASAFHLKELNAEPFLQAGDGVADGGLGAVELFGRRRKATQRDNGLQDLPFIEGGAHILNISSKSMFNLGKRDYRFEILSRQYAFGRFRPLDSAGTIRGRDQIVQDRESESMKLALMAILLGASLCYGQNQGNFKPATSNVLDAQYPRVDSNSRVQIRFKAPDAAKVKPNF
jgi:hypothetical protein